MPKTEQQLREARISASSVPLTAWEKTAFRINWDDPNLSFKRLRESVNNGTLARFREGNVESAFGQLLRAGIQTFAINTYDTVPVTYPDVVTEITSRRYQEYYAPLYRPNLPKQVERGEAFKDNPIKGLDRVLTNSKFGMIESFERELFDDDQTGQVKNRAAMMGENFKIMEEVYVMGKVQGVGQTLQGVYVPPSLTNADTIPSGAIGTGTYNTGLGNRPTSFARLSQGGLEAAAIGLMGIKDPLGNIFLVAPSAILVSSIDAFIAAKLMNSTLQPSVPSATAGTTGYVNTVNPLQGLYKVLVSRFLPSYWSALGDFKKTVVFQRRDPLEVVQEQPASGQSFEREVYRFKARSRFEVDMLEQRYIYLLDDGTASS